MKKYRLIVELNFHVGELHFIIPILFNLFRRDGSSSLAQRSPQGRVDAFKICLLFTESKVWSQFNDDDLLKEAVRQMECDVVFLKEKTKVNPFYSKKKACRKILRDSEVLLSHIGSSLCKKVLEENSDLRMKVVLFPHTNAPNLLDVDGLKASQLNALRMKQRNALTSRILICDPASIPFHELQGFNDPIIVGYHSIVDPWRSLVKAVLERKKPHLVRHKPYALVYSYRARDDVITRTEWTELHVTTYRAISQVFPDMRIMVKPHPYEDPGPIYQLLNDYGFSNVEITFENPGLLAENAAFAVSFLTGGFFNALFAGRPVVNYFNGQNTLERGQAAFKQDFGSLGVADVVDATGLMTWLQSLKAGQVRSDFIERKAAIPRIETREAFFRRIS